MSDDKTQGVNWGVVQRVSCVAILASLCAFLFATEHPVAGAWVIVAIILIL